MDVASTQGAAPAIVQLHAHERMLYAHAPPHVYTPAPSRRDEMLLLSACVSTGVASRLLSLRVCGVSVATR